MRDIDSSLRARWMRLAPGVALIGGAALCAFVAQASLPEARKTGAAPTARLASSAAPSNSNVVRLTAPGAAGQSAEEAVLIAFEEPVPGHAVVSPFGLRQLPWEGAGRLHEGVDISADTGVPVRVAADGVVVQAGVRGGYGRYVAVRHAAGLTTFYAHLAAIDPSVKPGLAVTAGDPVGRIGVTGTSTGPHLHFEIRDAGDRPLNPAMFLGRAFAEAGDLPLSKAKRYSGRVRIAQVSFIPESKRALMEARAEGDAIVVRRRTDPAKDLAAAERNLKADAREASRREKIDGLQDLAIGPDGRPRAQLSL